jgi:hypothetical protein
VLTHLTIAASPQSPSSPFREERKRMPLSNPNPRPNKLLTLTLPVPLSLVLCGSNAMLTIATTTKIARIMRTG